MPDDGEACLAVRLSLDDQRRSDLGTHPLGFCLGDPERFYVRVVLGWAVCSRYFACRSVRPTSGSSQSGKRPRTGSARASGLELPE